MRHRQTIEAEGVSSNVTILPTDTLLRALGVMERYHVRLLPVVEETGVLLGLVSEAHILAAWEADPFLPVSEVMAAWSPPWEWEEAAEADEQPPGVRLLRAVELLEAEPADGP